MQMEIRNIFILSEEGLRIKKCLFLRKFCELQQIIEDCCKTNYGEGIMIRALLTIAAIKEFVCKTGVKKCGTFC